MMIGGALPPLKLLFDHLVSRRRSIHPAVEMCKADLGRLEVRSDISQGAFQELPITYGNLWLSDLLFFRPSRYPSHDILIVHLDDIHGHPSQKRGDIDPEPHPAKLNAFHAPYLRIQHILLGFVNFATMLMLLAGSVCSILLGDMWSTALFCVYFIHSVVSVAVASVGMVRSKSSFRDTDQVQVPSDDTTRFAVYQRPEGGKIVFKGRQDTLETWARMAWTFQRSSVNNMIHWAWMVTGSLSATASVVCMVNMRGYLQLAYLGVLVLSSFLEILTTVTVRNIQHTAIHYGDTWPISDSNK